MNVLESQKWIERIGDALLALEIGLAVIAPHVARKLRLERRVDAARLAERTIRTEVTSPRTASGTYRR